MLTIVIILQLATLAAALYACRKALWASRLSAKFAEQIDVASRNTTRQLEALDGLYHRLQLPRGTLPPTRGWAASPDFLNVLFDRIHDVRPNTVIECGSGLTSIVTARALQQLGGGKLISLDHDPQFAAITQKHLQELGLSEFVEMHVAPLASTSINGADHLWYDMSTVNLPESLDMIVVDGPPIPLTGEEGRYPAVPKLIERLASSGVVILDDAGRPGERRIVEKYLTEFPGMKREEVPAEKGCVILSRT